MKIYAGTYTIESYKERPYKQYRTFCLWMAIKNKFYPIIKLPLSRKVDIE